MSPILNKKWEIHIGKDKGDILCDIVSNFIERLKDPQYDEQSWKEEIENDNLEDAKFFREEIAEELDKDLPKDGVEKIIDRLLQSVSVDIHVDYNLDEDFWYDNYDEKTGILSFTTQHYED